MKRVEGVTYLLQVMEESVDGTVFPLNIHIEALTPNVTYLKTGPFKR